MVAEPDMAASTCSQRPCSWQMAAMAGSGSMALEEVVPTVAQTKAGVSPPARSAAMWAASASGRMAKRSSTATLRRFSTPRPAIFMALSREEWVWEVA